VSRPPLPRFARLVPALTLAAALALAACGVGTDDQPHEIDSDRVPEGLREDQAEVQGRQATTAGQPVRVWFLQTIDDDVELYAVNRHVARPPTEAGILEALLTDGPDESERAFDITTAIPSSTMLASPPERAAGVLTIDLTDGIYEVMGDELRNAFAQLVCTAVEIDGVASVRFEVEGEPIAALDGNAAQSDLPLRCQDYAGLLPDDDPSP
jgi:spore germination protein GerM